MISIRIRSLVFATTVAGMMLISCPTTHGESPTFLENSSAHVQTFGKWNVLIQPASSPGTLKIQRISQNTTGPEIAPLPDANPHPNPGLPKLPAISPEPAVQSAEHVDVVLEMIPASASAPANRPSMGTVPPLQVIHRLPMAPVPLHPDHAGNPTNTMPAISANSPALHGASPCQGTHCSKPDPVALARMYEQVYESIPYSFTEARVNPGYRHQATMEILLGQLRPMNVQNTSVNVVSPQPAYDYRDYYHMNPYLYWNNLRYRGATPY